MFCLLKMNLLDYYTCKLFAVFTMESIVLRLRKTGLQKETLVRSYDGQIGPECCTSVLGQFGLWTLWTFKKTEVTKDRSDQGPKWM